nr:hypothetical protein CFP56_66757 [Quercus suber]
MRWNRRKAPKLVIGDDIVGLSKGCGKVFPNALTSFTPSFGTGSWRSEGEVPKMDKGAGISSFPSSNLHFFKSRGKMRQEFVHQTLHTDILVLAVPSSHFCKHKIREKDKIF